MTLHTIQPLYCTDKILGTKRLSKLDKGTQKKEKTRGCDSCLSTHFVCPTWNIFWEDTSQVLWEMGSLCGHWSLTCALAKGGNIMAQGKCLSCWKGCICAPDDQGRWSPHSTPLAFLPVFPYTSVHVRTTQLNFATFSIRTALFPSVQKRKKYFPDALIETLRVLKGHMERCLGDSVG